MTVPPCMWDLGPQPEIECTPCIGTQQSQPLHWLLGKFTSSFFPLMVQIFETSHPRHSVISNPIHFFIHLFKHSHSWPLIYLAFLFILVLSSFIKYTFMCLHCWFIDFWGSKWVHKLYLFLTTYYTILFIAMLGKLILRFSSKTVTWLINFVWHFS